MILISDIPKIHTALAEWGACVLYTVLLKRRFSLKDVRFWLITCLALAFFLGIHIGFSYLPDVFVVVALVVSMIGIWFFISSMRSGAGLRSILGGACFYARRIPCFFSVAVLFLPFANVPRTQPDRVSIYTTINRIFRNICGRILFGKALFIGSFACRFYSEGNPSFYNDCDRRGFIE